MDAQEFSKYGHVFRPGLFRRRRAFWLDGHILHWRKGRVKGHVPLSAIMDVVVTERAGGAVCRLVEANGQTHRICERHWFGWEVGERHRFGTSELHSATFASLVSAIRRRMNKERPAERG